MVIVKWRGSDKLCSSVEIGSRIYKNTIIFTFQGGFAVDADFADAFSGSIEGQQNGKKHEKSINFIIFSGGGSGPKHSAFCGACSPPSIPAPKILQSRKNSITPIRYPGGGTGPKHSAFCGACFSINPYRPQNGQKVIKSDPKNHEPSVFFIPEIGAKNDKNDAKID
jgi:hypothetical protein